MAQNRLLAVSPNLPCAMERQEWSLEDYHVGRTLYNGYAAQVYTATCNYSGIEVVLKIYHDVSKAPDVAQHEMYREVAIQSGIQHPNVVHLFGAFEEGDTLVLVQEYAPNGDLLALMQGHGGRVDEATVVKVVLRPLLGCLMYLHRWGIVHRDVKPENVLFAEDGTVKLADFGLAINMIEERPVSRVGTLDYMAPEVLRCPVKQSMAMAPGPNTPPRYGFATDVWAVGIVTYELLTGLPPYASDCRYQAESRICAALPPFFPHTVSPMARDFIMRLLAPQAGDRPTIRQVLEHPWIVNPDACFAQSRVPAAAPNHRGSLLSVQAPAPQVAQQQPSSATCYSDISSLHHFTGYTHGHSISAPHSHHPTSGAPSAPATAATVAAVSSSEVPSSTRDTACAPPHPPHHNQLHPTNMTSSPRKGLHHCEGDSSTSTPTYCNPGQQQQVHPFKAQGSPPVTVTLGPNGMSSPAPSERSLQSPSSHPPPRPAAPVPATPVTVSEGNNSSVLMADSELRALQQQPLMDLTKLPLSQIQEMIQKLQQAMQIAVVQQQQRQNKQQRHEIGGASSKRNVASSKPMAEQTPPNSANSAGAHTSSVIDVQMADVHAYDDVRVVCTVSAAPAVPVSGSSCARSTCTSPTTQHSASAQNSINTAAAAPVAPTTARSPRTSPHVRATGGKSARIAPPATSAQTTSPAAVSAVSAVPTTVGYHCGSSPRSARAATLTTEPNSPNAVLPLLTVMPVGTRPTSARGSCGGALHEGDGLVYVSIGSNHRKAAGAQGVSQCVLKGLESARVQGVASGWGQQQQLV